MSDTEFWGGGAVEAVREGYVQLNNGKGIYKHQAHQTTKLPVVLLEGICTHHKSDLQCICSASRQIFILFQYQKLDKA